MIDFLFHYGLFLAKTLTFVIAIIVTLGAIISMVMRARGDDEKLIITNINEKYSDIKTNLQMETMSKPAWKKWLKDQKNIVKNKKKDKNNDAQRARMFIIRFDGDIRASQVHALRECISAIVESAQPLDEVLVVLESTGGFVHSYGLAASQLRRIKDRNLVLTVAIDKFAASGGYMMACVAHKIIAAPFAIVGSIGVVAQIPNFHRLLTKNYIDFELHTAGEYKRTLTLFGENTEKAREKFQEELNETHDLFKDFISMHRPQVNINEVATGEHWHAIQALNTKLVDEIQTSDDYILSRLPNYDVFEINYEEKQKFSEKIRQGISQSFDFLLHLFASKNQPVSK